MTGKRKMFAFVLTLGVFATIVLTKESIDVFNLGLALTGIAGSFFAGNVFEHYSKAKKEV